MLVLFVIISSLMVAVYIIVQHYLMKRTMYQSADTVQRSVHNALQDSRNAANFRTNQLALSIEAVSKSIATIETIINLYGTQQACEKTELDLPNVLVLLNKQKLAIMNHAAEIYPEITPENPLNSKPAFVPNFKHFVPEPESDDEDANEPFSDDDGDGSDDYDDDNDE